jgi:hypothetical protein
LPISILITNISKSVIYTNLKIETNLLIHEASCNLSQVTISKVDKLYFSTMVSL